MAHLRQTEKYFRMFCSVIQNPAKELLTVVFNIKMAHFWQQLTCKPVGTLLWMIIHLLPTLRPVWSTNFFARDEKLDLFPNSPCRKTSGGSDEGPSKMA